jgi:hypothetical protein
MRTEDGHEGILGAARSACMLVPDDGSCSLAGEPATKRPRVADDSGGSASWTYQQDLSREFQFQEQQAVQTVE